MRVRWLAIWIFAVLCLPSSANTGAVPTIASASPSTSNAASLNVEAPRGDGRIKWRFRTGRWMNRQFVKVGPEGRVYTSDQLGLYAMSPGGELLWFVPEAGGGHPIDIGPDGTIYTGVGASQGPEIVKALNPDGSLKWEFVPPVSWDLATGPNVGPDGNIYGTQDFTEEGGLGFFSLDPQGNLRWANVGDPPVFFLMPEDSNSEVVFGPNRMYTGIVRPRSGGNPVTYAFDLKGNQIFYTGTGGLNALFHTFPRVDSGGRAIGARGQTGVIALAPGGATDWIRYHPGAPNLIQTPTVDSSGNIFAGDFLGIELWALTPDGSTRWVQPRELETALFNVGVSPNDKRLVASGSSGSEGNGWVRGYLTEDGSLLWEVPLEAENGVVQHSNNLYPVFSNDATTAYVTTRFANVQVNDHGYLYAIDVR